MSGIQPYFNPTRLNVQHQGAIQKLCKSLSNYNHNGCDIEVMKPCEPIIELFNGKEKKNWMLKLKLGHMYGPPTHLDIQ